MVMNKDYRYNHSDKGRARSYRFEASPKRREYRKNYNRQYEAKRREYQMERDHRIQNEAGCHSEVRSFYPAYRFVKSLVTAPVVEI